MRRLYPFLSLVLAVIIAALLVTGCGAGSSTSSQSSAQGSNGTSVATNSEAAADLNSPAQSVLDQVYSSVVNVAVTTAVGSGVGSGVVYTADGLILTNDHVVTLDGQVNAGQSIVVAFTNGRKASATIVGEDSTRDVAALKVNLTGLKPVTFGKSANVKLAEWAIVIGSPLNFQNSVTLGIVSGINRTLDLGGGQSLTGLLQVDAAISPGNSGGGCFDAEGNFIGMPELKVSGQSGAENLGFAIPSDVVKQVAHTLTGK